MATIGKSLWQRLSAGSSLTPEDKAVGKNLFREFTQHGYLQITPAQRITISAGAVIDFYRRLSLIRSTSSPVGRRKDDRWLRNGDFQFLNVQDYGSFFRMFMELPRLRTDSVIFNPVTECDRSRTLYPRSHSHLDKSYSDPFLDSLGLTLDDQFNLLLCAAHLCGKKTGYTLSPLIDSVSAVVYRKPEFFNWDSLDGRDEPKEVLVRAITTLVQDQFEKSGTYDYALLETLAFQNHIAVRKEASGAVCFDFEEEGALAYFSGIFPGLQSRFPLDFAYLMIPPDLSDKHIHTLYKALRTSGGCKRYTGWVLDLPVDKTPPVEPVEPVVLVHQGKDRFDMDEEFIHTWFHRLGNLQEKNKKRSYPVSLGIPLSRDKEHSSMDLLSQLFFSRFSSVSLFRRPLVQKGDLTEIQNRMEDIYQRYKVVLEKGQLLRVVADETFAWWIIREKGRLLIPLLALKNPDGKRPGVVKIDYSLITGRSRILSVVDYDFSSAQGSLFLSADHSLTVVDLKPGSFRLFSLQ
ncbi:hypothetical protein EXM22_14920 [Oceanispirochaeta crateris]|uniref:Uncharacterized protein n=1 Tax=Oceanispirochaeta crateris TaxID=2518645 RepID=A0A5C1QPE3_9SPIO|nr:hypothetical protein [Oceanispirochaeta crateris]QEN09208.1 hypothetical protein EXM22_14920 [Oceanispirochaeta crateris]